VESLISIRPDLSLRVLRPSESGTLYTLIEENRQHLRQWLPWVDDTRSPSDTRRFIEISHHGFTRGGGFSFGIHAKRHLVGVIGFHGFDRANRVTSLGYWLARSACGKGTMRCAVSACVDYAFQQRGMNRLYVRCATENERSRRIPEALGFVHEGCQRRAEWLYDHFVDLEMYSVLAGEWAGAPDSGA
jgi:ribosomal-protein-serine acetyltransferase